jgi:hypothetical protein
MATRGAPEIPDMVTHSVVRRWPRVLNCPSIASDGASHMRSIRLLLAPVVLVCGVIAACGGGSADTPASSAANNAPVKSALSGTVVDKNGQPVAGVSVTVFHHNNNTSVTATTDASGRYSIAGLDTVNNSDYEIYAEKPGYGFYPSVRSRRRDRAFRLQWSLPHRHPLPCDACPRCAGRRLHGVSPGRSPGEPAAHGAGDQLRQR